EEDKIVRGMAYDILICRSGDTGRIVWNGRIDGQPRGIHLFRFRLFRCRLFLSERSQLQAEWRFCMRCGNVIDLLNRHRGSSGISNRWRVEVEIEKNQAFLLARNRSD